MHDIEPDATATDDEHTRAGRDPSVADHGVDPGRDAASDDRGVGESQAVAVLDDLLGRADDLFGECAEARHLIYRLAVQLDPCLAVPSCIPARCVVVPDTTPSAPKSSSAATAMRPEGEDHMVAGFDIVDTGPVLSDDARSLVP